jgi:hypothetical protein
VAENVCRKAPHSGWNGRRPAHRRSARPHALRRMWRQAGVCGNPSHVRSPFPPRPQRGPVACVGISEDRFRLPAPGDRPPWMWRWVTWHPPPCSQSGYGDINPSIASFAGWVPAYVVAHDRCQHGREFQNVHSCFPIHGLNTSRPRIPSGRGKSAAEPRARSAEPLRRAGGDAVDQFSFSWDCGLFPRIASSVGVERAR